MGALEGAVPFSHTVMEGMCLASCGDLKSEGRDVIWNNRRGVSGEG